MKTDTAHSIRHKHGFITARSLILMAAGGLCPVTAFLVPNENPLIAGANYLMVYSVALWGLAWFVRMSQDGIAFLSPSRAGVIPRTPADSSRLDMTPPAEKPSTSGSVQAPRLKDKQPGHGHSFPAHQGNTDNGESDPESSFPERSPGHHGISNGLVAGEKPDVMNQTDTRRQFARDFLKDAIVAGTVLFLISAAIQYA